MFYHFNTFQDNSELNRSGFIGSYKSIKSNKRALLREYNSHSQDFNKRKLTLPELIQTQDSSIKDIL